MDIEYRSLLYAVTFRKKDFFIAVCPHRVFKLVDIEDTKWIEYK